MSDLQKAAAVAAVMFFLMVLQTKVQTEFIRQVIRQEASKPTPIPPGPTPIAEAAFVNLVSPDGKWMVRVKSEGGTIDRSQAKWELMLNGGNVIRPRPDQE